MRDRSHFLLRGLAATSALLPLFLAAACSSGTGSTSTTAGSNTGGAAPAAAAPSEAGAMQGNSDSSSAPMDSGAGGGQGGASVTIKEQMGNPDKYSFSPTKVTVSMGEGLSIVNKSDEQHVLSCKPDPGVGADMLTVAKSATQNVMFSQAGTYKCVSKTHTGAKITITVK